MYCLLILFLCLDSDWYIPKHLNVLGFCFIKLIFALGKNSTICKIDSQWEVVMWHRNLNPVLCDNERGWPLSQRRWEKGGRFKRERIYVYLWPIHIYVWQKPAQLCKQLSSFFFFFFKWKNGGPLLGQHFSSPSYWPSLYIIGGFAGRWAGKESTCNSGDPSSIPGMGISPGEGTGFLGYPVSHSSILGLPWWLLKNLLEMQRPRFDPWVDKIPWRREQLPMPVFLSGKFHGLYSPWGLQRIRQDWANFTFFFPLSTVCLSPKRCYLCLYRIFSSILDVCGIHWWSYLFFIQEKI